MMPMTLHKYTKHVGVIWVFAVSWHKCEVFTNVQYRTFFFSLSTHFDAYNADTDVLVDKKWVINCVLPPYCLCDNVIPIYYFDQTLVGCWPTAAPVRDVSAVYTHIDWNSAATFSRLNAQARTRAQISTSERRWCSFLTLERHYVWVVGHISNENTYILI